MTLMMIDMACRGSVEAPVRFPESLEVIDRNTRVRISASKIQKSSVFLSFFLYIVRLEVMKSMTSDLRGVVLEPCGVSREYLFGLL